MNNFALKSVAVANSAAVYGLIAKQRVKALMVKKVKGLDGMVVALLLIVIAVALGGLFKTQLTTWFTNIMQSFTQKSNGLF